VTGFEQLLQHFAQRDLRRDDRPKNPLSRRDLRQQEKQQEPRGTARDMPWP
jgi:hypothetical protein